MEVKCGSWKVVENKILKTVFFFWKHRLPKPKLKIFKNNWSTLGNGKVLKVHEKKIKWVWTLHERRIPAEKSTCSFTYSPPVPSRPIPSRPFPSLSPLPSLPPLPSLSPLCLSALHPSILPSSLFPFSLSLSSFRPSFPFSHNPSICSVVGYLFCCWIQQ